MSDTQVYRYYVLLKNLSKRLQRPIIDKTFHFKHTTLCPSFFFSFFLVNLKRKQVYLQLVYACKNLLVTLWDIDFKSVYWILRSNLFNSRKLNNMKTLLDLLSKKYNILTFVKTLEIKHKRWINVILKILDISCSCIRDLYTGTLNIIHHQP